jgi:hypothetical protein
VASEQRIWRAHKLQPHRLRTFKRSRDPSFAAQLTDIVGPYLDPPPTPLCCRSTKRARSKRSTAPTGTADQTRALPNHDPRLQAAQPALAKAGGTTTLFAALSVLDGTVIRRSMQRHRHLEFIRRFGAKRDKKIPDYA